MFANYGLTAVAAVSLEKTLLYLIAAIDHLGKETNAPSTYLEKHRKATLGQLIRDLNKRVHIPAEMYSKLKIALEKRNEVVHNFFVEQYETMLLPNGPAHLSNQLRPIRDLFSSAYSEVDILLGKVSVQLNKPKNEISPEVRKILKGKLAI